MDHVRKAAQRRIAPPPESASGDVESLFRLERERPGASRRAVDPAEPAVERGEAHLVVSWPERRCLAEGTRRSGHRLQVPRRSGTPRLVGDGCGLEGTGPPGHRREAPHLAEPRLSGYGCGR